MESALCRLTALGRGLPWSGWCSPWCSPRENWFPVPSKHQSKDSFLVRGWEGSAMGLSGFYLCRQVWWALSQSLCVPMSGSPSRLEVCLLAVTRHFFLSQCFFCFLLHIGPGVFGEGFGGDIFSRVGCSKVSHFLHCPVVGLSASYRLCSAVWH